MHATLLQNALDYRRGGKFAEAATIYVDVLKEDPENFEALHGLGILNYMGGRLDDARRLIGEAARVNPDSPDASYNLGCVLTRLKRHEEALVCFDTALRLKPVYLEALANRANVLSQLARHEEALENLDRAIAINPRIAEVWNNRAAAQLAMDRLDDALASYDKGLTLRSGNADIYKNRGMILQKLGRLEEALQSMEQALAHSGTGPQKGEDPVLLGAYADLLFQFGRNEEASEFYSRYVALKPEDAQGWYCRGVTLQMQRRYDEALVCYDKTLALDPAHRDARPRRANIQFEMERFTRAADDYAAILSNDPMAPHYIRGYLTLSRLHSCDWTGLEKSLEAITNDTRAGYMAIDPIGTALFAASAEEQLHAAAVWRKDKFPVPQASLWRGERYDHGKIRVAYLSADFRNHATSFLIAGVLEHHDNSRFEISAYSYGADDKSPMRARLEKSVDVFHEVRRISDADVASMLRRNEVDIAVDLKGFTAEGRLGILSYRPAPVQAHYLGFPGTLDADFVDYLIADPTVVPREHRKFYREKIVYLPDTYQCNDRSRSISPRPFLRMEAGLPEKSFVFCCFNNNQKILPHVFDVWMRLLREIEGSVLWLLKDNDEVVRNLRREASVRGVAPERLIFAPRISPPDHLARHKCADLFLDTMPYNAHTTASDALWAGLPVITVLGDTFASRVAASLLRAAGMPELVTDSLQHYEALALNLARDPAALSAVRAKLARLRDSCALFDTALFTRNLEAAYCAM